MLIQVKSTISLTLIMLFVQSHGFHYIKALKDGVSQWHNSLTMATPNAAQKQLMKQWMGCAGELVVWENHDVFVEDGVEEVMLGRYNLTGM